MPSKSSSASALSPEYALLGFLAQRPAHGYELHQQLTAHLGHIWRVSLSQSYNILNRLEARGLITGTLQKQSKLPDRRSFRLTSVGRRQFLNWLGQPTPCRVRAIRVEFTTRLYFTHLLNPDQVADLIEAQSGEVRSGLQRLQIVLTGLPADQTFNRLGLELRTRQLTSLLDWLSDCRAALGLRDSP